MIETSRCPQCGAQLPDDAPAGLCPKCLVQAGFESEVEPQPSAGGRDPVVHPTLKSPAGSGAGFVPPSLEELAPLFPQLELLELVGKGGMGAVYKARQRGLDRLVAIKILPPEIGHDAAFAERFTREARALARLSHNHIVSVYDFGQSAGLFYIVMEYVDGVNLRQTIQSGGLAPADALAIVPQICEALQFAHDEGIVHRDIKPENILIDKKGRVKIADFGLAKLLGHDAADHSLTGTHQLMGTLRYMAPEQMQGSREVDHRADIYSLGVVFYELLTGELPMGKFAPPSKKVQVDVRLDEIVLRALEQEPEQRYQHASEVKTAVEAVSRSPGVARPESAKDAATGPHLVQEPRYSRFAIAGAVWALFGLLAVIPTLFFIALNRVWNGTALPTDLVHEQPPLPFLVFMVVLLAIGAGAPIGTTIYGALAIGHIKRSGGRTIGLPLAVVDAFFFPVLILGFAASALTHIAQIAIWTRTHTGYVYEAGGLADIIAPDSANRPDVFFLVLDAIAALVVCFFAGRAAWRAIAGSGDANPKSPRVSRQTTALVAGGAIAVLLMAIVILGIRMNRHGSQEPLSDLSPAAGASGSTNRRAADSATDEGSRLQGDWLAVAGERNGGQPLSAEETSGVKLTFDRNQMRVIMQGRNDEGTFKLDSSQRPKRIAVTRTEGPNRFGVMDGIYELDGDHLRICMGEPEDRPTEFKTKAGSRLIALDLVRQSAVGPIAFEAITRQCVQTGTLAIDRLGKFDVTYRLPFAQPPTFIFPREKFTGPGRFVVEQSTPTSFTIDVRDAAFAPDQPVRIGWLAIGVFGEETPD